MATNAGLLGRRKFLRIAGATALWTASAAVGFSRTDTRRRILVIGGGSAGLAAVTKLRAAGFYTILIEARSRLGGRIWTNSEGLDLGASWIHGQRGNPLMELVSSTGSPAFRFDYDNQWRYDANGLLSDMADRQIDRDFASVYESISRAQRSARKSSPLSEPVLRAIRQKPEASRQGVRYAVNSNISLEYAADPDALSLAYFDHADAPRGGDLLLPSGYAKLLEAMDQPDELHLGEPIQSVEWRDDSVRVTTGKASFEGDAAIVTVPLGVLKSGGITFSPDLPERHQRAIKRLGFGTLNKLFLRFPRIAWPVEPHLFGFVGNGWWEEWVNFAPVNQQPILLGFNAGAIAEQSEKMTDQQLARSAVGVLRTMFGRSLPDPVGVTATRWRRDPYSLGSYSNFAPGSTPNDCRTLADPISKTLLFAGEACSLNHSSTVHGALQSGRKAADFLIRSWA